MVLAVLVELAALRGDLEQADTYLQAATPLIPMHTDWTIVHGRAAAALAVARGEYAASTRPSVRCSIRTR